MNKPLKLSLLVAALLFASALSLKAQQPPISTEDTTKKVHILNNTRTLTLQTIDDSTKLTIVTGDVKMRQGTALFYCDSCILNSRTNVFEAWGRVHINDSDTAHIYSNHLRYLAGQKLAYLDGNVRMTDGKATLTTPDLEYDMQTNLGTYKNGGKVINKKSVLTSQEGYYYTDLKDVYFKKNVVLKDPAYNIETDSLLYNTTTQTTRFISYTTIKDSTGRVIKTREGFYNQQTGKAEFGQNPEIKDGARIIRGNRIAFDDSLGIYQVEGNAVIIDTAQGTTIIGGLVFQNKKTEAVLATRKPLMIIKQQNDSIYITADTLFSARLSDMPVRTTVDTSLGPKTVLITSGDSLSRASRDSLSMAMRRDTTATDSLHLSNRPLATLDSVAETLPRRDTAAHKQIAIGKTIKPIRNKAIPASVATAPPDTSESTRANAAVDSTRLQTPDSLLTQTVIDKLNTRPADSVRRATSTATKAKDSTDRYFEAYSHVRIFSDSLQAVCDSMFYSFKDSVFRLFKDPVVWAQNSQVTGDTILLFTRNKKADKVEAFENSFLVNRVENDVFNQIKSTRMDGWFVDGNIDSVRARSYAECIYYIQDEDSAYTGINQSQCDIIDIYFEAKELEKVVFRSQVTGTIWPINQKGPKEMQLTNFRWLEARRPKTKFEMFE